VYVEIATVQQLTCSFHVDEVVRTHDYELVSTLSSSIQI
jgi:hypothetical protein